MTATVSVHEAKTHLSRLIERVLAGEEIVIARNKEPVVRLVRASAVVKRPLLGSFERQFDVDDAVFAPLPDQELKDWGLA